MVVALGVLAGGACVINPGASGPTGSPASAPRVTVSELPRATAGSSVWVVATLGLNLRSAPDPQSQRLTTVDRGARLDVSQTQKVGSDTWLHVKTQGGDFEGWVLDRQDLVIHRSVSQHVEVGAGWSILFPSDWTPTSGNPATFTSPPGDAAGGSMLIQTADDPAKLLPMPTAAGKEQRQESPIEVYGFTTFLTIYKLDAGGYEYDVRAQFPKTKAAYLISYKETRASSADTTAFKQLLTSMIVPGEG
jgi:hypothetical protein